MSTEELKRLVRQVVEQLDGMTPEVPTEKAFDYVEILRKHVTPNCHVGKGDEMRGESPEAIRMTVEWYAGQILDIVDSKAWYAMNSILNCRDKFLGL